MNAPEMRNADAVIEDALYAEITHLLTYCTERQIANLWHIYMCAPASVRPLKVEAIRQVLGLVQRTVRENQRNKVTP